MAAAWILERTLASSAPATGFVRDLMPRFEPRDQDLLQELVMGSLRWLRRLDQVLSAASHRPFDSIERGLRAPLRVAAYQLLFLDRIPAYAVVDEAVEEARQRTHRGGASFVNAVLRRIARDASLDAWPVEERDPARRLAVEMSHPDFLVARWWQRFGEERTRAMLVANNTPKPLHLLAFRDRGGRELLAEELIDAGLEVEPSELSPTGLVVRAGDLFGTEAFARGDVYVQDEASQVAAVLPPPRPGERVLDVAAAPGGKSFSLQALEPSVRPTLLDVSPVRVLTIRDNLRRLGRPAPLAVADGVALPTRGGFERVVLDLPCSGTGTFRKHPELKWRLSPGEIGRLAAKALDLVRGAAPHVAPGGVLAVITCSLEAEENEEVVERFLAGSAGLGLRPLDDLPAPWDRSVEGPGRWRLFPGGDHDGFTVHVLERR